MIPILLMQLALILALSRVMGWIFGYFRQPVVMGEMIAGIMLGPSVLGWLSPTLSQHLFPAESVQYLNILSQLGVIFFLFLVGLELDPKLLKNRGHTAVVISHVSIIAPFLLGAALTIYLYPRLFNNAPNMSFTSAALFIGAAMSITAFPVLARILTERNLHKTKIGAIAITCAAVDDVTAWCMLAFVVGVARADGLRPGIRTAVLAVVYIFFMLFVVRPFLRRLQGLYERQGRLSQNVVAVIFLLTLASAYATEAIGIHALFGAFIMGAIMPKGTKFIRTLSEKLEDYTVIFLLPIFFAYTGLRTQIGLLDNADLWLDTGLVILVACAGKFGGSTLAGKACGLSWAEASTVGILMNTRGLMELVILNIGLQEGVITPAIFAMMVLMALVTTALTTPVLHLVFPTRLPGGAITEKTGFSILIPVSLPESGPSLARLAATIIGGGEG
ncbi:MAG TPA: cation:proton antiporter, partial [Tepidisphaeraceae bacterium]|nr:cation:proton antiporter [Tepidisphaeraceae bacterium]